MRHSIERSILVVSGLVAGSVALAQRPPDAIGPQPSVEQWNLFTHKFDSLYMPAAITPQWLSDGSRFVYRDAVGGIKLFDPERNELSDFVDAARLRRSLGGARLSLAGFRLIGDQRLRFTHDGVLRILDLETYEVAPVPADRLAAMAHAAPRFLRKLIFSRKAYESPAPNGRWVATELDHDLALRSTSDGSVRRLTDGGAAKHRWDVTTVVWAPDGSVLAAAQVDRRGDHYAPILHWLETEETIEWLHYPKNAPGVAAKRRPPAYAIIDPATGTRLPLDLSGLEGRTLYPLGFRPGNQELLFITPANDGADFKIVAADVGTGSVREVLTDVGGFSAMISRGSLTAMARGRAPDWARGREFLVASDRDETLSLYSYGYDGTLVRRITPPGAQIESVIGYDAEDGWLYVRFRQGGERAYDLHLGRAKEDGSGFEQITRATGAHRGVLSPSKRFLIDTHSAIDRPHQVDVLRTDGSRVKTLATSDASNLYQAGWIDPEEFRVTAADGATALHGVMLFPPGFDPMKRYPVFDAIYNGPQTTIVPSHFLTGARTESTRWARQMSQLGFISVVVDSRGTPGRGRRFQEAVFGRMGQVAIPDHIAAIRELAASRPFMDLSRVGVSGHSYGGYHTLRAMLTAPDFYHVGVAGAPSVDHMDLMPAQSGIMRFPEDNPEGYALGSNPAAAGNLKGRLLLIHGGSDANALLSGTMRMARALVTAGKPFDMLIIPEMDHYWGDNNQTGGAIHGGSTALMDYDAAARARYLVEHLRPEGIDYRDIPMQRDP